MIGRFHERACFERVARDGLRVRAGTLWCTFVHDPMVSPPKVAYSLGRAVGTAVTRNRIRRRLRSLLHQQLDLPPGLYLFGLRGRSTEPTYLELMFDLTRLVSKISPLALSPSRLPRSEGT